MTPIKLNTINKKLTFLVLLAVLPALLILLYSGLEQRRSSIEEAKHNVSILAHSMAQVQHDISLSTRGILSTLALLPEIQAADIEASSQTFKALISRRSDYKNISLIDLQGNVLASALPFTKTNIADRKHFIEAVQRKEFSVGEFIITRIGAPDPALPFAFPVIGPGNNLTGILTATIDLKLFAQFHKVASLPSNSFVALTDHQGLRLFYYPPKEGTNPIGQPINPEAFAIAEQAEGDGLFLGHGSDGASRVFAFEQVRLAPTLPPYMYLWAGIPERDILQAANNTLIRNLLFMLFATGIALLVSRFIGDKTLAAPIKKLIKETEKFASGKLSPPERTMAESGELGILIQSFYDMADRLIAGQKTLQENEARFRIIMDSLDTLVVVADMATYEILFINKSGKEKFGNITGKTCWQHLHKDQEGPCPFCTNKYLEKEIQDDVICSREIQNSVTGDWYHVNDRAIRWTDGRTVKLEVATDISELKRAEKQRVKLEQQIRQKGKVEAVGIMAGGIAHNFNNSLAVILGNIEVSKLKLANDSAAVPYLEKAKKAVQGSSELVRQILTYSHQWSNERIPVQPEEIIHNTLNLLESTVPSSINVKKVFSENSLGVTINADPSQIQYALTNICNNAIYAMAEKGNLIISLETVNLQPQDIPAQYERPPGDYVKLSVEDTGAGMPSDIIDKIFDPFFTTKEVFEGTGMGLATVYGIMNQHGGLIKVSSIVGQGSIVKLYFPKGDPLIAEPISIEQEPLQGTERILFIDDEVDLASTWSLALTEYGYQVTTESSSQKALELFRENPAAFDLVITDQTMPELTGKEFIKEILIIRQDIPTILCTGYSHAINEETARKLGVKAFCMKPVVLQELLKTIRHLLDKN